MAGKKRGSPLGIGILGTGLMGGIHAEMYACTPGCRIIGYHNRTRDKAAALARRLGGEVFETDAALLADERIDAVSICTAQAEHARQFVAAANAGKHILCEKPLALTVKELDAVEAAAARNRVTTMVAHQLRFHPVVEALRREMPRLGRVYHLDLEMCFRIGAHTGRCWTNYRLGGFFMELGVHLADLARHLMGPIRHISGHTLRLNPQRVTEDYTHCVLEFNSRAVGSIIVSANHRTTRQGLLLGRVIGEKGRIDFTLYPYARAFNRATMTLDKGKAIFVPDVTVRALPIAARPSLSKVYPGFYDVYLREVGAFVRSVRRGTRPPVTLAEGRSAVEVVLATYDAQGRATASPNAVRRGGSYRSDRSCHPLLGGA